MKKYYIVGNRAFNSNQEALQYCKDNDFNIDIITEATTTKKLKYYELQVQPIGNRGIYHNTFLTSDELQEQYWINYIKELKNGEYCSNFIHLKEISNSNYLKWTS